MKLKKRFYKFITLLLIPMLLMGTVADIAAAVHLRPLQDNDPSITAEEIVPAAEGGAEDTGSLYAYGTLGQGLYEDGILPYGIGFFSEVSSVSTGRTHSLALMESGDVYSWGYGTSGRLGHGDSKNRLAPQKIETLQDVRQISAGGSHSLALLENGAVYAFGYNKNGQLGTGDNTLRLVPTRVELDGEPAVAVSAGFNFSLVLMDDGTVRSFGQNDCGQLGLGKTDTPSDANPTPTEITEGLPPAEENPVVGISAGKEHALAVLDNGDVYSFGRNDYGQLGLGIYGDNKNTPQKLARGNDEGELPEDVSAVGVAASVGGGPDDGVHSLILLANGDLYSCGRGINGRLGQGDNSNRYRPSKIVIDGGGEEDPPIVSIFAGGKHSMAIDEAGQVYVCGENDYGQLGLGDSIERNVFTPITELPDPAENPVMAVSGSAHSLVLMEDGTVYSFGLNNRGQLGQGTQISLNIPTLLQGFEHVKTVSGGGAHSLLLLENGRVFSCGLNDNGQLGHGDNRGRLLPTEIKGLPKDIRVATVAAGRFHSLAVLENGEVYSWGYGEFGQLGHANKIDYNTPKKVVHLTNIVAVSAGRNHSAVVNTKGEVFTFGLGSYGRLGHGEEVSYLYPKKIEVGLPAPAEIPAVAVAAGGWHTLVLLADGAVYSCGRNLYGELGLGDVVPRFELTEIAGLSGVGAVAAIAAGKAAGVDDGMHSLALLEDGDVYAFGRNECGQLGLGDTVDRNAPTKITGLPGDAEAVAVAAGGRHSLVLQDDGKVYGFGDNEYGQLGLGDKESRNEPVEIAELDDKWIIFVAAGGEHSLAFSGLGPAYSFGNTADGRIGRLPLQAEAMGPGNMKAVSAGGGHILILLENGAVYSYGYGLNGRLGLGDESYQYEPVRVVAGLPDPQENPAVAVAAGGGHSLVLLENGDVYAFGWNDGGQLGLGDTVDRNVPTKIAGLPDAAVAVAAGEGHSLVVLENGDVYAFGRNDGGQLGLGLGDTVDRNMPTKIEGLSNAVLVAAGGGHSLAVLENGDVYAFGRNDYGQLGLGLGDTVDRSVPTQITGLPDDAAAVAAGDGHSLILTGNGDVYVFGQNDGGQLGLGDTDNRSVPEKIMTGLPVDAKAAVAAGGGHSLILTENGDVYAFGRNGAGQLSFEDNNNCLEPTKIEGISSPVKAAAAGHSFTVLVSCSRGTGVVGYRFLADDNNELEEDVEGVIDTIGAEIELIVPYGTDLSALVADFELSYGAEAAVGATEQVGRETANEFSVPVTYTVTAEDGATTREWTVMVEYAPNDEAEILNYKFKAADNTGVLEDDAVGIINDGERTIELTVSYGTDLSGLVADFELSYGAQAFVGDKAQISGATGNCFQEDVPLTYTVVAEDGTTTNDWTVTVGYALNTVADFLAYDFAELEDTETVIDGENEPGQIAVTVPFDTDVTALVAEFELSYGAEAKVGATKQVSGITANDFTAPVTYTVTAEDGVTTREWTVTVTIAPNDEAHILTYKFKAADNEGNLDHDVVGITDVEEGTVTLTVPYKTVPDNLIASFTLSYGAKAEVGDTLQVSGVTGNNFTAPVTYRVEAMNKVDDKEWTVTVEKEPASTETNIVAYGFRAADNAGVLDADVSGDIDAGERTIALIVPYGTDLSGLVADFALSYEAEAEVGYTPQDSGVTANDFSDSPVIYTITAEDGTTTTDWTITVEYAPNIATDFISYGFKDLDLEKVKSYLDEEKGQITVAVPPDTDITALVAEFELSDWAEAEVGETPQVSGETANDFTVPVIYTVTAQDGTSTREWTVTVRELCHEAELLGIRLTQEKNPHLGQDYDGVLTDEKSFFVEVPEDTDRQALVPIFELSPGAKVFVVVNVEGEEEEWEEVEQISGETALDFTDPVIYKIVSEDGEYEDYWSVIIAHELPLSNKAEITSYAFLQELNPHLRGDVVGEIDAENHEIRLQVHYGTDGSGLIANFELSEEAIAKVGAEGQDSGETPNFFFKFEKSEAKEVYEVNYVVVAQNGREQAWKVKVEILHNDETKILSFGFSGVESATVIDGDEKEVTVTVPFGTDIKGLRAVFVLSPGAWAEVDGQPQNGGSTPLDFTNPITYTIKAQNEEDSSDWMVTVVVTPNHETEFLYFEFNREENPALKVDAVGVIDGANRRITVNLPPGTDVSGLVADFDLSPEATAYVGNIKQIEQETDNDFSVPVTYRIVAGDKTTKNWTVEVKLGLYTEAEIISFGFTKEKNPELRKDVAGVVDRQKGTVNFWTSLGADIRSLIADFELSPGATAKVGEMPQVSGVTPNDFRAPITYQVTGEAGNSKAWQVSVFLYGDVNGDKKVDVTDAILVLRQIVRLIELDDGQKKAAKVSGGDGEINVSDAILILRYIVKLIDGFPADDS